MTDSRRDKGLPPQSVPQENAGNTVFGQATVPPSPTITPDQLAERLIQSGLMSAADLKAVQERLQPLTLDSLIAELVSTKKFTRFQIDTALAGHATTLCVGEYVLLDKIGAGGMGQVFRALHRSMNRVVALEVLPQEAVPSKDAVQRFLREVQAIAKLSHPNIVAAHDAGEQGGRPYLAMEFIQGTDLNGYVKQKGPLPIAEALNLVSQTARGLHYAHSAGVIHRDIKPLNLLLNAEGVVKILDLGLAKVKGDATVTAAGVAMGTPDYLSPEQGVDAAAVDHRTDIYGLGCTLYFLLTGKSVYQGDSFVKIIMAHQKSPAPSLREARPDVPEKLDAVFQKMLAKKPADRYQSMTEVIASLSSLKNDAESKPRSRRSRRAAALLFVSTLVAAGVLVFVGYHQGFLGQNAGLATPTTTGPTKPATKPTTGPTTDPLIHTQITRVVASPDQFESKTVIVNALLSNKFEQSPDGERMYLSVKKTGDTFRFVTSKMYAAELELKMVEGKAYPVSLTFKVERGPGEGDLGEQQWLGVVHKVEFTTPLSSPEQVQAVMKKLKELNPDFDGEETHTIEEGVVTELSFLSDKVTDLSPVRALPGLKSLDCSGSGPGKSSLTELSPLKGLPLTELYCHNTQVADLSPLKGMPLTFLNFGGTKVSDLSPLRGMPLTTLQCGNTQVADLSPLKDMKMLRLVCLKTQVADLSPLKGMPLTTLQCGNTQVADLTPLREMPLNVLSCNGTKVSTLSSLKGMPLTELHCHGTLVEDLSPLKGMSLTLLSCGHTKVSDLSPLRGMPLTTLQCGNTQVADLSPLKGMPLTVLWCADTKVSDLSPLKGMKLTELQCHKTKVSDLSPLKEMPLKKLGCDPITLKKNLQILRSIKTLETIRGKPASEFLK